MIQREPGQAVGAFADNATFVARVFPNNVKTNARVMVGAWKWSPSNDAYVAADCTQSAGGAVLTAPTLDRGHNFTYNGTNYLAAAAFSSRVTTGGSCTMQTAGAVAGSYLAVALQEATSTNGVITPSAAVNSNSGNSASPDTGNITAGGSAQSIFLAVMNTNNSGGTAAINPDGAFGQIYEVEDGVNHQPGNAMDQIVSAGAVDSGSWTLTGGADNWCCVIVSYDEPAGGSAGSTTYTAGGGGVVAAGGKHAGLNTATARGAGVESTIGLKKASAAVLAATGCVASAVGRKAMNAGIVASGAGTGSYGAKHGGISSYVGSGGGAVTLTLVIAHSTTFTSFGGGRAASAGLHGGQASMQSASTGMQARVGRTGRIGASTVSTGGRADAAARHAGAAALACRAGTWASNISASRRYASIALSCGGLTVATGMAGVFQPDPARILKVLAENRSLEIGGDKRTLYVQSQSRLLKVKATP